MTRTLNVLLLLLAVLSGPPLWAVSSVAYSEQPISIDAQAEESIWQRTSWRELNFPIIGKLPDKEDFSGRYQLAWDHQALYIHLEVTDDILVDRYADPRINYWDDDCVEIFVDEDASGGEHTYNYNAFAYHVALDGNVADIGLKKSDGSHEVWLFNDHVKSAWRRVKKDEGFVVVWELAVALYADDFSYPNNSKQAVRLAEGKEIGFMLAYCDADQAQHRESFVGSFPIDAVNGDRNLGYRNADVFEKIRLVK